LVAPFVIVFRNVLFPALTIFLIQQKVQDATLRAEELVYDYDKGGLQEMDSDSGIFWEWIFDLILKIIFLIVLLSRRGRRLVSKNEFYQRE